MSRWLGFALAAIALTLAAGAFGGWIGVRYGLTQARETPGLDEVIHHDLHLDADQRQRIAGIEAGFALRREALDAEMRAANHDLADALATEHALGPAAERAIGRFHAAMGELQRQSVAHVMAMRAVLGPAQIDRFDRTVTRALAPDARAR